MTAAPGRRGSRALAAVGAVVLLVGAGRAIAESSSSASAEAFRQLQLGYVALDRGDLAAAMEHYARAEELAVGDEQRFQAALGLGSTALELDRPDEARAALERAHRFRPQESGATFLLGVACRRQGDAETAVRYLAEAAAREPGMTSALVELGIAYGALDRHADAERVCRAALELEPDNLEAGLGLAVALYHQDEVEDAAVQFRRVLELDPGNLRAHYGLGLALLYSGDRQGALEELRALSSAAPDLASDLHGRLFPRQ
ncbi:MAG: tetratricopeptide repeat protein [Thermoanaerobaculales bacterium]|jgi:tetratricopeptide (TPR) repeat protein|nr:tetratricopeptide repeat protein [Thermoanaerobaculales bacterium]